MSKVPFIITIDTEGDNLWSKPKNVKTHNVQFIPRFQELCQSFGFKPVYLSNHEMVENDDFVAMVKDWQDRGDAEIGIHVHAWNSPPILPLTTNDDLYQPYLYEYTDHLMEEKFHQLYERITERVGMKPISHRAGRWAMDDRYFQLLKKYGVLVDCSVTPHVNWSSVKGNPLGTGGTDYRNNPETPYQVIEGVWEVPMTIGLGNPISRYMKKVPILGSVLNRFFPALQWLRPNGRNLKQMMKLAKLKAQENGYLEFMLHSSELMPGGSPYFPTEKSIEILFSDLEKLFSYLSEFSEGNTLKNFIKNFKS